MKVPHILFLSSELRTGGAERQWSILIPGLAERGFDVRLLTLAGRGRFFDEIAAAGVPCKCAELASRWDVRGLARALELAKPAPDVVLTQGTNAQVLGHLIASRAKARHVTIDHTPPGLPRRLHRRLLVRFIARRVDYAIAVSRSQVPDLAHLGFDPLRLRVIYNGLPAPRPTRSREEARASLGIESRDFVILVLAALRAQKRVPVFIEAVASAHARENRIKGIVAGGGPDLEDLRTLAEQFGSSVNLLGERSDVADLIVASDAVCLTSWTEATPLSLIEAMALGRPVIAGSVGGVSEIVVDGETGFLVPRPDSTSFASAFRRLAAESSCARVLGEAGKRRFERLFTVDKMLDGYVALLQTVIASKESSQGPRGA